jgi:hypothetical protein
LVRLRQSEQRLSDETARSDQQLATVPLLHSSNRRARIVGVLAKRVSRPVRASNWHRAILKRPLVEPSPGNADTWSARNPRTTTGLKVGAVGILLNILVFMGLFFSGPMTSHDISFFLVVVPTVSGVSWFLAGFTLTSSARESFSSPVIVGALTLVAWLMLSADTREVGAVIGGLGAFAGSLIRNYLDFRKLRRSEYSLTATVLRRRLHRSGSR